MKTFTDADVKRAAKGWKISEAEARAFMEQSAKQAVYAAEYEAQGVDTITAFVMANDRQSADARWAQVEAGEIDALTAVHLTGSYAALDMAVRLVEAGHLKESDLMAEWPDLWRGTDPDDTDPRFLRMWRRLWIANGRTVVRDGRALPRRVLLNVYRGQRPGDPLGIAWTLDPKIAGKFAATLGGRSTVGGGSVLYGRVHRDHVLGYLTKRGESEVVIDPRHVAVER